MKKNLIIPLLILNLSMFAHEVGSIRGKIYSSINKKPLIGANIIVDKTMIGEVSDLKGEFTISNIHSGNYMLIISYIGFVTQKVDVLVEAGKETQIEVIMVESEVEIDGIDVHADRPFTAASLKYIRNIDLEIRPNQSSQDLLKLVPGLITAQHAGGGKAEQIFLRGFDADHGTDVAVSVDGIPVNMVSHGHGQGYADLHFLIPELVNEINVFKGPYSAESGNLATAGSVQFKTKDRLTDNIFKVEGGQFNTYKATILYQLGAGSAEQNGYIASQYFHTDGPFEKKAGLERANLMGKYFINMGHSSRLSVFANTFSSAWDATGQIPQRAVDQGYIGRFGSIEKLEGGQTGRTNVSLKYEQKDDDNSNLVIQSYFTDYHFKLFSNFTFFLEDEEQGDMIEQLDNRFMHGLNATYNKCKQSGKTIYKSYFGGGYRNDNIELELWHSPDRIHDVAFSNVSIQETDIFSWVQEEMIFSNKFRIQMALRGDFFTFNVQDHLATVMDTCETMLPHASGYSKQNMLNPKLNIAYTPADFLEFYINGGSGFHSNDARNIILVEKAKELNKIWSDEGLDDNEITQKYESLNFDPEMRNGITLPRATGGELGVRTTLFKKLNLSLAGWFLHLQKEYVYVGDGGFNELSNPTRRLGVDVEARVKIAPWFWADADLCLSDGKIIDVPANINEIPLAPRITSSGGITVIGFNNFNGSIRYIHVGDRPANEENTVVAIGYTILNAGAAYQMGPINISITIENLLNTEWNEAQFNTESRLPWETDSISEIHFTPGNPRNFQFGLAYKF